MKIYISTDELSAEEKTPEVLGGKGFGLFEMVEKGVPVPPFAVIPTDLAVLAMEDPDAADDIVQQAAETLVGWFGKKGERPLLSVRSGARVSMPGMMDTILNVGVGTPDCIQQTEAMSPEHRTDCRRRFLQMYATTCLGMESGLFEAVMEEARAENDVEYDSQLGSEDMALCAAAMYKLITDADHEVPQTLTEQVAECIWAVLRSWDSPRAKEYRQHHRIPDSWGTAVVVQAMVFGNLNDKSGSGVLFSRDPSTGENKIVGEYLPNAQGEDVVAGIRTPLPLSKMPKMPLNKLAKTVAQLEAHYADMLDIEFTVQDGELFLLQVRAAKRSSRAAVRCAIDLYKDKVIAKGDVRTRITRAQISQMLKPVIDPSFNVKPHATAMGASAGIATGRAVFTAQAAVDCTEPCILIRHETSPDDIAGMFAAEGVLTATGGSTSHAAVVARGIDKPCVVGCVPLDTTMKKLGKIDIPEGTKITIDGATGRVWVAHDVPVTDPTEDPDLEELMDVLHIGKGMQLAMPDGSGQFYTLSQFMADVPVPDAVRLHVADDTDSEAFQCPSSKLVGASPARAYDRMAEWAKQHKKRIKLYSPSADWPNKPRVDVVAEEGSPLARLMSRPCAQAEVEAVFGGGLEEIMEFVGKTKFERKIKVVGCAKYDLLAAFGGEDA